MAAQVERSEGVATGQKGCLCRRAHPASRRDSHGGSSFRRSSAFRELTPLSLTRDLARFSAGQSEFNRDPTNRIEY